MLQRWCLGILFMAALTLLSSFSLIMTHIHSGTAIIAQESQARRLPPQKEAVDVGNTRTPKAFGHNASIEKEQFLVDPSWLVWSGFDDKNQQIFGSLRLKSFWPIHADDRFQGDTTPINSLDVINFVDANVRKTAVIQFENLNGSTIFSTSSVFVGGFAQLINPTCFPFDEQTMKFMIRLQAPADKLFDLGIFCPHLSNSNVGAKNCTKQSGNKHVIGFHWGAFTCIVEGNDLIVCSMTGVRDPVPVLKTYLIPSAIFSAMGYISFRMDNTLRMPRVATTMLALVTLNTLKVQLTAELPAKEMSWLEEYLLVSIIFMFLNLVGHILSFSLVKEHPAVQHFVDNTSFSIVSSLFLVIVCVSLVQRNCKHVSTVASVTLVGVPIVLLLVTMLFTLIRIRQFKVTAKLEFRLDENDDVVLERATR